MQDFTETVHKKASLLKVLKTIGWGYFGVRSQHGHQDDFNSITLCQTIIIGILFSLVFIVSVASLAVYVSR